MKQGGVGEGEEQTIRAEIVGVGAGVAGKLGLVEGGRRVREARKGWPSLPESAISLEKRAIFVCLPCAQNRKL